LDQQDPANRLGSDYEPRRRAFESQGAPTADQIAYYPISLDQP